MKRIIVKSDAGPTIVGNPPPKEKKWKPPAIGKGRRMSYDALLDAREDEDFFPFAGNHTLERNG